MDNPNEYSDENYTRGAIELEGAIGRLWEAGAELTDIEETISNALENATGETVGVTLV